MLNESINHTFTKNPISPQDATISTHHEEKPSPHTMKITKNPMSPQDLTIFTHHEDNQVHYANVKDVYVTIGSKTNL